MNLYASIIRKGRHGVDEKSQFAPLSNSGNLETMLGIGTVCIISTVDLWMAELYVLCCHCCVCVWKHWMHKMWPISAVGLYLLK